MGGRADILDMSVNGMGIRHDVPLKLGEETFVEFKWSGALIQLRCQVSTTRPDRTGHGHCSGLQVTGGVSANDYKKRVLDAVKQMVEREVDDLPPES